MGTDCDNQIPLCGTVQRPFLGQGCCMPGARSPEAAVLGEMGAPPTLGAIYLGRNRGIFCIFDKAALYKRLTLY